MYSDIYAYDASNDQLTETYKRFRYLDGSRNLNWKGIKIESIESQAPVAKCIYFKDYYFSMSLGDMAFQVNTATIETKAGDIFITPRNKAFDLVNNSTFSAIRCTLSHDFIKLHFYDKNIDHVHFTENYSISDNNIRYLMLLIYEQAVLKTDFADPYLNHLFDAFVLHYIKDYSNYSLMGDEGLLDTLGLMKIDRYIEEHLADNITSAMLAELSAMSNFTFLNAFKKLTGKTPHQYLLQKKLEASKNLLLNSRLTIMSISHELGFTDSSHFSNFFKKQTGCSPSNYRKY